MLNQWIWKIVKEWLVLYMHGSAWYGGRYGMVWYGIVWCGMAWYGVWYGIVRYGIVRHGMVWYDML